MHVAGSVAHGLRERGVGTIRLSCLVNHSSRASFLLRSGLGSAGKAITSTKPPPRGGFSVAGGFCQVLLGIGSPHPRAVVDEKSYFPIATSPGSLYPRVPPCLP